jgi:hypothetical protein
VQRIRTAVAQHDTATPSVLWVTPTAAVRRLLGSLLAALHRSVGDAAVSAAGEPADRTRDADAATNPSATEEEMERIATDVLVRLLVEHRRNFAAVETVDGSPLTQARYDDSSP